VKSHVYISAIILALSMAGCGGWSVSKARRALDLSARAVNATDSAVAAGYEALNDDLQRRIDSGTITVAQFDEERAPWQLATQAVESVRLVVRSTEHAVDVWERLDDDAEFLTAVPCMFLALKELRDAMEVVGVQLPQMLDALDFVSEYIEGTCAAEAP